MGNGTFCVVLMKRLAPIFAVIAKLDRCLGGGKSRATAIHGAHIVRFQGVNGMPHGAYVFVQHANESSTKQKVESDKRYKCGWIVEHGPCGILQQAPLLEQTMLHQVAQAVAVLECSQNFLERFAPL